jgi:hypothetical protein
LPAPFRAGAGRRSRRTEARPARKTAVSGC